MQDHEFYADPTVFDHWQSRASEWLCRRTRKLCPYGWALAFAAMAGLFALIAVAVFIAALVGGAGQHVVAWNHAMAQVITIMMAMLACQALLQQALRSWPAGLPMPRRLRRLVRLCGWKVPVTARPAGPAPKRRGYDGGRRGATTADSREDVQAFFAGVRAAGVNVAIARALFSAGVRTPRQLCRASDECLLAIRGVGPATVNKLRAYFDCV